MYFSLGMIYSFFTDLRHIDYDLHMKAATHLVRYKVSRMQSKLSVTCYQDLLFLSRKYNVVCIYLFF